MSENKSQLGPRLPKQIAEDYRTFVDHVMNTTKGRLSKMAKEAFILQMGLYYCAGPSLKDNLTESQQERFENYAETFKTKLVEVMSTLQARRTLESAGFDIPEAKFTAENMGERGPEAAGTELIPTDSDGSSASSDGDFVSAAQGILEDPPDKSAPKAEDLDRIEAKLEDLQEEIRLYRES